MSPNATSLYKRLQYPDSIRLLKLSPAASQSEHLRGELVEARLSERPSYQALSYMWGPEQSREDDRIWFRQGFLSLRTNLACALRAIRKHRYESKLEADYALWVDLICIEQHSVEEKNHQVAQMGSIYSQAICVLSWLGRETRLNLNGFALTADKAFNTHYKFFDRDETNRAIFCALLNQHWHRTWILQETGLARDLIILTEDLVFGEEEQFVFWGARSTKQLLDLPFRDSMNKERDPRFVIQMTIKTFIELYERQITRHNRWTLLGLIGEFGAVSGCAEYRDKVFALRALANNGDRIQVDYSIDKIVLFWIVIGEHDMRDIHSKHVWNLKNALQLEWTALFESTRNLGSLGLQLREIAIPVRFEQGSWRVRPGEPPDIEESNKSSSSTPWQLLGIVDMEFDFKRAHLAFNVLSVKSKTYQVKRVALVSATDADNIYAEVELSGSYIQILPHNWRGSNEDQSLLSPDMAVVDAMLYIAICLLFESKMLNNATDLNEEVPSTDSGTDSVSWRPIRLIGKWVTMASSPGTSS